MFDKLLNLFKKSETLDRIHRVKKLGINPYLLKTIYNKFDFVSRDVLFSIDEMREIINNPKIETEIIQVKMISKETKSYISFGEWFTNRGYFLEDPKEVLRIWCDVSKDFIKLCERCERSNSRRMIQNYRQIRPYKNEIDILTEFLLESV